jgi:pyroglutamyl-peptidase
MMNTLVLFALAVTAHAAPTVLISGFDPFRGRTVNNSWTIAREVRARLAAAGIDAHECHVPTSYARSAPALEACLRSLPATPDLVLSLGEVGCAVKVETRMFNLDHNDGPGLFADNDNARRNRQVIVPGAPRTLGMRFSLPDLYCSLSKMEQRSTQVSAFAGHFVCNHLGMQFSWNHPELVYGFIHVPEHSCRNLDNAASATAIVKMALAQLAVNQSREPVRLAADRPEFVADWARMPEERNCAKDFLSRWGRAIR